MTPQSAANHVRRHLAAATPEQLTVLGSGKHRVNGAPNFTKTSLNVLRQALREAGYESLTEQQSYISARTYAGLRQQKTVPRNTYWDRGYAGIEEIRGVPVAVIRSADIDAQAVFWVLLAGTHLDPEVGTYFMTRWIKAGLPLPRSR